MSREGPDSWRDNYFARIMDVVTQYEPDLLYTDGGIPFGDDGLALVAHLYNTSARRHGGKVEAIYTSKSRPDSAAGMCVLDVERGVVDSIWPRPWQTDTCIGNWHYDTRAPIQDPQARHRHAGGHRQPQRQSAAEFPVAQQRHARRQGAGDPRRHHRMDGGEQ